MATVSTWRTPSDSSAMTSSPDSVPDAHTSQKSSTPVYLRITGRPPIIAALNDPFSTRILDASEPSEDRSIRTKSDPALSEKNYNGLHALVHGADGHLLSHGSVVKWLDSSGLWLHGTVEDLDSSGTTAKIKESSGVVTSRPVDSLYLTQKPLRSISTAALTLLQPHTKVGAHAHSRGYYGEPGTDHIWDMSAPSDPMKIARGIAAHKLAGLAGIPTPETRVSPDGKRLLSRMDNTAEWDNLSDEGKSLVKDHIKKNYPFDAWIGVKRPIDPTDVRVSADGVTLRTGYGDALGSHASGGTARRLDPSVPEWKQWRDSDPYKDISQEEIIDGLHRILAIAPHEIHEAVSTSGLTHHIADDLIARRAALANSARLKLPETTALGQYILHNRRSLHGVGNTTAPRNAMVNPPPSSAEPTDLGTAVRPRHVLEDLLFPPTPTPGSAVWLRRKPTPPAGIPPYPDTWYVDTVSADHRMVGIHIPQGIHLTVPRSDVMLMPVSGRGPSERMDNGMPPVAGDTVSFPHKETTATATVTSIHPHYTRVRTDEGTSKLVPTTRLTHTPQEVPFRRGLYTKPFKPEYDDIQNANIKQAEHEIRGGNFAEKSFYTADLTPTQSEERTQGRGSGRGAHDLGPIVAKINDTNYLLDGHHRAYNSGRIKAQYVDLDNPGNTAHAVGKPFDFVTHDYIKNAHPMGFSTIHNRPAAYVGPVTDDLGNPIHSQVLVALPHPTDPALVRAGRIPKHAFRDLSTIDPSLVPANSEGSQEAGNSTVTPVQALTYTLPTTQTDLDNGVWDEKLLKSCLIAGNTSGDSTHDPLLATFAHLIGADAPAIQLDGPDFAAYMLHNSTSPLFEGWDEPQQARDVASVALPTCRGVYGHGLYSSDNYESTLSDYGRGKTANVVEFTPKPATAVTTFDTLTENQAHSLLLASRVRMQHLQMLGVYPGAAKNSGEPLFQATIDILVEKMDALSGTPLGTTRTELQSHIAGILEFYADKDLTLGAMHVTVDRYSKIGARILLRLDRAGGSGIGISLTLGTQVFHPDNIFVDLCPAHQLGMRRGLATIESMDQVIELINPEHPRAAKYDADNVETAKSLIDGWTQVSPLCSQIRALTARMNFILDPGRFALASGTDVYTVPQPNEVFHIFTNRNCLIYRYGPAQSLHPQEP